MAETYFVANPSVLHQRVEILDAERKLLYIMRLKPLVVSSLTYYLENDQGDELLRVEKGKVFDQGAPIGELRDQIKSVDGGANYHLELYGEHYDLILPWRFKSVEFDSGSAHLALSETKFKTFGQLVFELKIETQQPTAPYLFTLAIVYYAYWANGAGS